MEEEAEPRLGLVVSGVVVTVASATMLPSVTRDVACGDDDVDSGDEEDDAGEGVCLTFAPVAPAVDGVTVLAAVPVRGLAVVSPEKEECWVVEGRAEGTAARAVRGTWVALEGVAASAVATEEGRAGRFASEGPPWVMLVRGRASEMLLRCPVAEAEIDVEVGAEVGADGRGGFSESTRCSAC